jgi:hypothetical protein
MEKKEKNILKNAAGKQTEAKITKSPIAESAMTNKQSFEDSVKKAMDECVKDHQHNHPLYQETRINGQIIDKGKGIAAWVLFEQIDTDRCTPEGDGWLGDQYRYSVWYMEKGKEAKMLHEDHAYLRRSVSQLTGSRGRDCSIDLVSLDEKGVIANIVPEDSEGHSAKRKVRITKNGKVTEPEISKDEKTKVNSGVKKKIVDVLETWSDAQGNYSKSENAGTYSSRGRCQVQEILRCVERGDWKGASEAYRGGCSDFWDAGYDWDSSCGGYTLKELDKTVSAIRAIAEGKEVKENFLEKK